MQMETTYFYSMGSPSDGATGLVSINNGNIAEIAGSANTFVTAYKQSNPNETDQQVYDYFSNWNNGDTFTLPQLLNVEQLKQFLGF